MFYVALPVVFGLEKKKFCTPTTKQVTSSDLHKFHNVSSRFPLSVKREKVSSSFSLYSQILERKHSYRKVVTSLTGCIRDEFP